MIPLMVLLLATVMIVILILTTLSHIRTDTPYGGTSRVVYEAMIRLAALRGREVVYDIGAGDGRILLAAKRRYPGIQAIGYECALGVWLLGKVRVFLSRVPITLSRHNALGEDLSRADVVFLYLGPTMMQKLLRKFSRELRRGTRIVSHSFRLPGLVPAEEVRVPAGGREKKLYLYRW